MVKLLNELSQTVETFETDEAFYRYLESRADESWQFKIYPPEALDDLLKEMGEKSLVYMAYQARQQKRDMLVIGVGEEKNPFFFYPEAQTKHCQPSKGMGEAVLCRT